MNCPLCVIVIVGIFVVIVIIMFGQPHKHTAHQRHLKFYTCALLFQVQWILDDWHKMYMKILYELSRMCELSIHQSQWGSIQLCK